MRTETIFVNHLSEWTSLDCLAVFRWDDASTPRTDAPVRWWRDWPRGTPLARWKRIV